MIHIVYCCILLFALTPGKDDPIVEGAFGEKLDRVVQETGGDDFWGAVLVAKDKEILLAKGYGKADYKSRANTHRTLFELASASKQITAAAILHLQQKKKLKVTDTLEQFFKNVPEDKKTIQVHHLLTHTSGISGSVGVPYDSPLARKPYVKQMLAEPLIAQPGAKYEYSNVGYALLAAIVEEAAGGTFEKYVEKHLFKPVKMKDSGFIGDRDLIKSKRVSSRKSDRNDSWTAADWLYGWGYRGMGGVVTTVMDLYLWDQALRGDKVLNKEMKKALFTPFKDNYAYGWEVITTSRGTRRANHTGGVEGYGTQVIRYLEEDACVFVLSNQGKSAYEVSMALDKLLFKPVTVEAVIDTKPYGQNSSRIYKLPKNLKWKTVKKKKEFVLQLLDKKHKVVEVRAPKSYAAKIVTSLKQAIAAREADDDGEKAAFEAGLYLQAFRSSGLKINLDEKLSVEIRSEYRGRDADGNPVVDPRVLFYLNDLKHRCWPVMVKMNVAGARSLLKAMEGV